MFIYTRWIYLMYRYLYCGFISVWAVKSVLRSKISEGKEREGEVCFIIHILWYGGRAGDCIVFAVKFPAAVEHRLAVVQTVLSSGRSVYLRTPVISRTFLQTIHIHSPCFCDACGPVAEKLLRSQIRRSVGDCQYITRWPIYNMIWWMGLCMDRKDGTKIQKS